jgi:hypothetical protein
VYSTLDLIRPTKTRRHSVIRQHLHLPPSAVLLTAQLPVGVRVTVAPSARNPQHPLVDLDLDHLLPLVVHLRLSPMQHHWRQQVQCLVPVFLSAPSAASNRNKVAASLEANLISVEDLQIFLVVSDPFPAPLLHNPRNPQHWVQEVLSE